MLFTLIIILVSGWFRLLSLAHLPQLVPTPAAPTLQTIHIQDQALKVELAQTPEALTQGLSGRESIGSDGMLFILPSPQVAQFWMKDMRFDLDFIWIGQAKILGITPDVPRPSITQTARDLPLYSSPPNTEMVLEVPAGKAKTSGWHEGGQVVLW